METFTSPGTGHDVLRPFTTTANRRRSSRRSEMTPARQIFGSLANRGGGVGKGEFTPLLKSVQRSSLGRKVAGMASSSTPAFMKSGGLGFGGSPALPQAGSSDVGDSTYRSRGDDEETPVGPMAGPASSVGSTPVAPIPRGKGGVLEYDGQMTLREQEKVCWFGLLGLAPVAADFWWRRL
jgi:hypothetical protein